jgi:hypothetical protein
MSKQIPDVSLVDLLNPKAAKDPILQSIAVALDLNFQALFAVINDFTTLPNINNIVDDRILDYIGLYVLNSPGYSTTLTIARKQWLLNNTILIKRKYGTRSAIESLVSNLFSYSEAQAWYEYGGNPFHFRILIADEPVDPVVLQQVYAAIYTVKSVRDFFDGFIAFAAQTSLPMFIGFATGVYRYQVHVMPGG